MDGDEIKGRIKVKVGPIAMTYAGTARFTERDPQAHVITLEASGKETRGAGTASATVRSTLRGDNGETHVVVHTTLNVTGRPAQFGRGVMAEVGGKLIGIFASNLADMLAAERPAEPPAGQAQEQAPAGEQEGEPDQSLESLNLNVRSYNSLRREGIHTGPALAAQTREQLLAIDNIGPASVEEISQKLADRGLTLSDSPASRNGVPGPVAAAPAPAAAASAPAGATAAAPAGAAAPSAASDGHARSPGPAAASPATEPAWSPPADDGAINLLSVAGMPVLKRAIPVAAALAAAALIALRVRVKRRRARG